MPAAEQAKDLGKRVIGYQDDVPPVIDTVGWLKASAGDPTQSVCHLHATRSFLLGLTSSPGYALCDQLVPHSKLASPLQCVILPSFASIAHSITADLGWFYGDVVAGITVGMVLVPQGMSYAQIATLSPEYGLYSSFVGVLIYCVSFLLYLAPAIQDTDPSSDIRDLQGCIYRTGGRHVSHRRSNHTRGRRGRPRNVQRPTSGKYSVLHLRIHRSGHRHAPLGMVDRIHPCPCGGRFHDGVRHKHCH